MSVADRRVRDVFVSLADALVRPFDVIDLLDELTTRCSGLLGVTAAGLLLVDHRGALSLVAASTEQAQLAELAQLQNRDGPCLDAQRTGRPVRCGDITGMWQSWPGFAPAAGQAGFAAVHALPMRVNGDVVGALNLFDARPGDLTDDGLRIGQALADLASVAVLHDRAARTREFVFEQLQAALNSRILVEQASGVLAERLGVSIGEAFRALRDHSRREGTGLAELARTVVDGSARIDSIAEGTRATGWHNG